MGRDLYAKAPVDPIGGRHFGINIWWWAPLWQFSKAVCPDLPRAESESIDDWPREMSAEDCVRLAVALRNRIARPPQYRKRCFNYSTVCEFARFLEGSGGVDFK